MEHRYRSRHPPANFGGNMTGALDLFRLDGKVTLVTGGTGIYGQHIVRALAEAGAVVIVASRDGEKCRAFAQQLCEEGLRVEGDFCDLVSEPEIRALRDRLMARHGR